MLLAEPLLTLASPAASMAARSPTFSTAFFAVAVQTPPEHVTFAVVLFEIVTSAYATRVPDQNAIALDVANSLKLLQDITTSAVTLTKVPIFSIYRRVLSHTTSIAQS